MLLSKAVALTDTVTDTVTAHLPGPVAGPVRLAAATLTFLPRQLASHGHARGGEAPAPAPMDAATDAPTDAATDTPTDAEPQAAAEATAEPAEPEVVLTLDRPAEEVEPPIDVVGEALRAEAAEQPPAHEDEDHVEVEEEVVFSSGPDGSR